MVMIKQGFFSRIIVNLIGFYLAAWIFDGFVVSHWLSALGAAVLLIIVNMTIGTLLKLISLPFIILTVGLFIFVVNAISLLIVDSFVAGIHFAGFWPAVGTAVIMAIANAVIIDKD
jgi:putative membrane protein